MYFRYSISLFLLILTHSLIAQQNMSLIANATIDDESTDIWGYVDQSGVEYAIMGAVNSTRIFSLADPANPVELINIPGDRSGWRDIKSNGEYIYVIADQGNDGLLIIDMTQVEDTITYQYFNPIIDEFITSREDSVTVIDTMLVDGMTVIDTSRVLQVTTDTTITFVETCHNLYSVDGFIYLAGCNGGSRYNGVLILDPSSDPFKPVIIGKESNSYAHDVYVNGNTLYASEINRGALGIFDISDKTAPQLIGSQTTGLRFTHNAWTNDDGTVIFTTDERSNAFVEAYDISDPSNIQFLDNFQPLATVGRGVIPHNTHYHNGFLYTSYYTDGVIVTDAHKPDNLIQVGQYDTWPGPDGGFNGNWGTYPFLPSGLILASDRATGLYVLQSDINRACYLEGTITDKETGLSINGVSVEIISKDINTAMSDAAGSYKTGQASSGTFEVQFLHPDYRALTVNLDLVHGECLVYDAVLELSKKLQIDISTTSTSAGTNISAGLSGVVVTLSNPLNSYEFVTSENGRFTSTGVNSGNYTLVAGKWGFKPFIIDSIQLDENKSIQVNLEQGIEDDFLLDLGWNSSGDSNTGQWERAVPIGTFFGSKASNVTEDLPLDNGNMCYVTGNGGGNPGLDDVDDGDAILTSPLTALSSLMNPVVRYSLWFYNDGGTGSLPDDTLNVYVTNQSDTILLEQITDTLKLSGVWRDQTEIELSPLLTINDSMQFIFKTSDYVVGHIVEAGLDGFSIIDKMTTSTSDVSSTSLSFAYPNPTQDILYIEVNELEVAQDWALDLHTIDGRMLLKNMPIVNQTVSLHQIISGTYILRLRSAHLGQVYTQKLVKI